MGREKPIKKRKRRLSHDGPEKEAEKDRLLRIFREKSDVQKLTESKKEKQCRPFPQQPTLY